MNNQSQPSSQKYDCIDVLDSAGIAKFLPMKQLDCKSSESYIQTYPDRPKVVMRVNLKLESIQFLSFSAVQ